MSIGVMRRNESLRASNLGEHEALDGSPPADALAEAVAGCQRGDRDAQRVLYELCHERVFAVVARIVGRDEASDVVQEIFLQTYRTISSFSGKSRFTTWLWRLAVNEALQSLRRARRRRHERLCVDSADARPTQERRVACAELLDMALARIDPDLRAAFVLKETGGLAYRDMAEALGVPEGTVASRLNRARVELRHRLIELGWEP